jgi:hypothetical protein
MGKGKTINSRMMLVKYADIKQCEILERLGIKTGSGVNYQVRKLAR